MAATSNVETGTGFVVLTAEGRERLEERLAMVRAQLADVEEQLERAEDRTELLEERLRLRDRASGLRGALARAISVGAVDEDPEIVELGDEVEIEHADGDRDRLVLVHPLEADPERDHVSVEAPLARVLLGTHVGDEVTVDAPAGSYRIRVLGRRRSL